MVDCTLGSHKTSFYNVMYRLIKIIYLEVKIVQLLSVCILSEIFQCFYCQQQSNPLLQTLPFLFSVAMAGPESSHVLVEVYSEMLCCSVPDD